MGPDGVAEQRKPRDRSGRIESVLHTGNFEIVVYHSGLKLFEIAEFDRDSPDFQKQLNQADSKKYLILENGKRVNKDLKMIPKVLQLEFVDDEGVFYGRQNAQELEEEPEFYTIYKLKIVPDEN